MKKDESPKERYFKSLISKKWYGLRKHIILRDEKKCTSCGNTKNLQVHHLYYVGYRLAWEYDTTVLITLCRTCHEKWHEENGIVVRPAKNKRRRKPKVKTKKGRYADLPANMKNKTPSPLHIKRRSLAYLQSKETRCRKKVNGEWQILTMY